jgi:ArsR family transcriptional regulator
MSKGNKNFSMERFFRALADRTRLRVLNLLGDDEVCVCFLAEILQTSQPSISRHLAYMKRAGIVGARRDGKWMHYRIVEPPDVNAASFLSEVRAWLAQDKAMQRDRDRLVNVCCSSELPLQLQGAPKPASLSIQQGA